MLGISNLHISTIFLLNAGTVPTVCYIFVHFIIAYEKNPAELQLLKKYMVIYLCFGVSVSTVDRVLNSTWVDLITFHLN